MVRLGLESELVLVADLLYTGKHIERVAGLIQPSDIGDPRIRAVYTSILELDAQGETVDPSVVGEYLNHTGRLEEAGGYPFLAELLEAATADANLDFHARAIRKAKRQRAFEEAITKANLDLAAGEDPHQVHDDLNAQLSEIGDLSGETRPDDDLDLLVQQMDAELVPGRPRGIKWPWDSVTKSVGRLVYGDMWVVSGFSGQGKSTFLRSLTIGMLFQGVPVVYFSIEEKGDRVLGLMSCAVGGASYTRYGRGYPLEPKEVDAIKRGRERILATNALTLNYEKSWQPARLLSKLRLYIRQMKCAVVVIDHAHLIEYPANGYNLHMARFAERLHAMLQEENVIGLVAYQPRKPGEGGDVHRPVSPDEIRGASEIWNIAENTLSPFRPWVEVNPYSGGTRVDASGYPKIVKPYSDDAEPAKDYFFLQPGKARIGGAQGKPVVLRFDPLTGRIYE